MTADADIALRMLYRRTAGQPLWWTTGRNAPIAVLLCDGCGWLYWLPAASARHRCGARV